MSFFKRERGLLLGVLALLVCVMLGDASVLMADAVSIAPAAPEGGTAGSGSEGLQTQMSNQAGSVTNLERSGDPEDILAEDIDEEISKFRTDFFPLDTIARKVAKKQKRSNYVVKHFHMDSARVTCETNAEHTGAVGTKRAELKISGADKDVFGLYDTINVRGVDGYDETGQIKQTGADLMLYVVGISSGTEMPIVIAINGPKQNATDAECYIPDIPTGTALYSLSNAGSESQLFCPPSNMSPVSVDVYMQRKLCNTKFTEYFRNVKKKVSWDEQDIQEQALWEFRRKCEASYLLGRRGKITIKDSNYPNRGPETVYFQEGVMWQVKKTYDYTKGKFMFNDLLGITKMKFTGNNGSKEAYFGVGKDLLEDMHKIDYKIYKELSISPKEKWGIKFTSYQSTFGTINVVHMPILDEYGLSDIGLCLDLDFLVRYYQKDMENRKVNMETQGEDAERNITVQIDCLCLKGFSHLLVKPLGSPSVVASDPGMVSAATSDTLPESPKEGQVVYLTANVTANEDKDNFVAGQLVQWNGVSWQTYNGEVFI